MNDEIVAPLELADTWATRARGMLWRRTLPPALLIRPCNSVHGAGMTVALDVALLDARGTVLEILLLRPWRVTRPRRGAVAVLEAPQGSFDSWGLTTGDVLRVRDETSGSTT
ncbi:DUF192 domain-containing protein [Isoptericola jiangsuensis]|uniref:DUF192 domain-containing protein n=1 Tax=Isoptericola jiangsuensis TaxID=548579 RepID=UPI003AAB810A